MTDGRKQVASGVWYLLPTVVSALVPLATLPILTRTLSVEEFGVWGLAGAFGVVASGAAGLGLAVGYERNFFQYSAPRQRAALLYSVLGCAVAAAVLVGAATWIWRERVAQLVTGNPAHGVLMFLGFCANVVAGTKALYLLYFKNQQQARLHAIYSIDETILGALASLTFVVWFQWGPMGLLAGQLLAGTIVLVLVAGRVGRELTPGWSWPLLRDTLAISLPLTPRVFLGVVGNNFDKYLIGQLGTIGGVGLYTLGQRLAYAVFQVMTAVGNVFTPVLYQRMISSSAEVRASVGVYLTPYAWISAGLALALALFAEEALAVLTAGQFVGAAPVVSLLSLSYGLMFFGKVPQLSVARKTWMASVLTLISLVLLVAINIYTVPRWGAVGAAAGTLMAGAITAMVVLAAGQYAFPVSWERGRLMAIFGVAAGGAILAAFGALMVPDYFFRFTVKLGIGGVFLALGHHLGYVEQFRLVARDWSRRRG